MIGRAVGCLLLLGCAGAVVDFGHSRIYDEFDFKGQSTITIDGLCENTCAIYASVTPDSKKFAANLLIQQPKGFTSVADLAARYDAATGQKTAFIVNNIVSLSIVNANAQYAAGPLVLYVLYNGDVYSNAQPEVYEAEGMRRPESTLPPSVTVMSARPFTVKQALKQGSLTNQPGQGAFATMAGYKNMDEHICPYLYYSIYEPFQGFTMEVNGPILSIMWDYFDFPDEAPGELTATIGITNKRQMERSGWISSPGFHGCPRLPPYRSSLYDYTTPVHAEITNSNPEQISVDVLTNTDAAHAVTLTNQDNGAAYSISNIADETRVTYTFKATSNVTLDWTPDGTGNTHFLAQWHSLIQPW